MIGYDVAVGGEFLLGVEADITSSSSSADVLGERIESNARQISIAARGAYPVSARGALFASAGYSNVRISGPRVVSLDLDGFRVGASGEYKLDRNIYTSLEYRFSDYELVGGAHQLLLGLGVRF